MSNKEKLLNRIYEITPKAGDYVHSYRELTPDNLAKILSSIGAVVVWSKLLNWEQLTDVEIYKQTVEIPSEIDGGELFLLLSDADVENPVCKKRSLIKQFVCNYIDVQDSAFYNGDAVFISSTENYIYIFHHEGVYTNVVW
jgi:hypothetical protein